MAIVRVRYTADEARKIKANSDNARLDSMTEEEINRAAMSDPDSALPTDEELVRFKRRAQVKKAVPKDLVPQK